MDPEDKTVTFQILGNEKYTLKPNPLELCRLCANTDNQLIPIFKGEGLEHDIPSKLEKHLPIIKVTETDKLPLQICYQCASTLIAWHNFYEGSSVADKRLREILDVDEKYQDAGTYEDFGEDFRDDDFDQSHIDLVESIPLSTTSTNSQHEELNQNESVSEITQLKNSKILNETASENTTDERCLRWKYGSTNHFDNNVGANLPGIRRNTTEHSSFNDDLVDEFLVQQSKAPLFPNVSRITSTVCKCVWSNDKCPDCAQFNNFKCTFCQMVFLESSTRNRHLRTSHKTELVNHCREWFLQNVIIEPVVSKSKYAHFDEVTHYSCNDCSATFENEVDCADHFKLHSTNKEVIFSNNRQTSKDITAENSSQVYECSYCSKTVLTKKGIKRHLSINHHVITQSRYFNKTASETAATKRLDKFNQTLLKQSKAEENVHGDDASKDGYYTCDTCDQIFLKRHSLTRHVNMHTSSRYDCDKCRKSFVTQSTLVLHQHHKHKEVPKNVFFLNGRKYLKCDQCTFTCRNERNKLEEHMRVHTGEKPFTCELCGKQFRTKALLRVHSRYVHEGIKEHACDICGRCFSNKRYMEEHRRIHTGEKPLICDLCGKTFRQNSSLSKHVENHLGIKRHACSICDKRFSNSHHLSIHLKRHLGETSHMCEHCGKKFVDQYQLKNHTVVHSEARPFICRLCGTRFKLRKHLKQHERTHRL